MAFPKFLVRPATDPVSKFMVFKFKGVLLPRQTENPVRKECGVSWEPTTLGDKCSFATMKVDL